MSDFRESLNHSMGIKSAPCLLTFGSGSLYLAYIGPLSPLYLVRCYYCEDERFELLGEGGLVCVLWRNCLPFCANEMDRTGKSSWGQRFLFKTRCGFPLTARVGIINRNEQNNFLVQERRIKRRIGWSCGQGWLLGRFTSCQEHLPQGILPPAEPKPGSPAAVSFYPSVLLLLALRV